MKFKDISPVTDVGKIYSERLSAAVAAGVTEFREFIHEWRELAPDAEQAANAEGFEFEKDAMEMERRGRFSGEDAVRRFGAIILPENLMRASMVAVQYHVPDGLALRRLVDVGRLKMVGGVFRWQDTEAAVEAQHG